MIAASPEASAQFKLDALATNFFEPLEELRARKLFFVSDSQLSSLDCLAVGYLSLMLVPELPQAWLSKTMRRKFPELCQWTEDLRATIFGKDKTTLADAFLARSNNRDPDVPTQNHLPWKPPCNMDVLNTGKVVLSSLAESIPGFGQLSKNTRMRQHGESSHDDGSPKSSWQYIGLISSVIAGLGLGIGYMFQQGLLSLPEEEPKKSSPRDLGPLGDALGFHSNDTGVETPIPIDDAPHGNPVVEVELARDVIRTTETMSR